MLIKVCGAKIDFELNFTQTFFYFAEYPLDTKSEEKLLWKCNRIFNILMNLGYLSALSVILKYYVEMLTKGKDTFQINIE